jgi:hypothetical protein
MNPDTLFAITVLAGLSLGMCGVVLMTMFLLSGGCNIFYGARIPIGNTQAETSRRFVIAKKLVWHLERRPHVH